MVAGTRHLDRKGSQGAQDPKIRPFDRRRRKWSLWLTERTRALVSIQNGDDSADESKD